MLYAHHWIYEELVGPIPDGLHLANLCGNRSCVSPFHHEPMTRRANAQLKLGSPDGSRRQQRDGYVKLKRGEEWLPEHRAVMEEALGRRLAPGEIVHHINGDRSDNRFENLQLVRSHRPGQAHQCRDCGSTNIGAIPLEVSVATD